MIEDNKKKKKNTNDSKKGKTYKIINKVKKRNRSILVPTLWII